MNVKTIALSVVLLGCFASANDAQELSLDLGKRSGISVSVNASHYGRGSGYSRGHSRRPVQIKPVRPICSPGRTWIPGHYEMRTRRVWVPGTCERVWVPPVYETRYDQCGNPYTVLVRGGHFETITHPGHYETRRERVWVPGAWSVPRKPTYY